MSDDELRRRVRELEKRVAELEALVGKAPPAPMPMPELRAAPPGPVPLPPEPESEPAAPRPWVPMPVPAEERRARPPRGKADLERFFGLDVLGRVGVAALLLAGAYFGQLGWAKLGPGTRTAVLYASGLAMVGAGFLLQKRVVAKYTAMLWGGGTAITYLAGVLGHLVFAVMPSSVAIVSLLVSTALGQFLAWRSGLELMATISLAGAYAAPVLVGTPSPTPTAFFTLLLALHGWSAWTEHRWRWHSARALATAATITLVVAWYAKNGMGSAASSTLHTTAVWLGLALPELLAAARRRDVARTRAIALAAGFAVSLLVTTVRCEGSGWAFAPFALATAGVVAGALLRARAEGVGTWLARAASLFVACGFVSWLDVDGPRLATDGGSHWLEPAERLAGVAILALTLLATRNRTGTGDLGAAAATVVAHLVMWGTHTFGRHTDTLARWPALLVMATPLALLLLGRHTAGRTFGMLAAAFAAETWVGGDDTLTGEHGSAAALALAIASGTAALGTWVAARARDRVLGVVAVGLNALVLVGWFVAAGKPRAYSLVEPTLPLWNPRTGALAAIIVMSLLARSRTPAAEFLSRGVLAATALVALYVAGLTALLDAIDAWTFGPRAVATSIYTLAFASVLLVAGFRYRIAALRWTALATFGAVVVKIAAYDLRETETPVRMLVTAVLGGVLLTAAWAYAQRARLAKAPPG